MFVATSVREVKDVLVNKYGFAGAREALRKLALPRDYYIINITHQLGEHRGETGNMQLFVTGTIDRRDPTPLATCMREVQEEVGLRPSRLVRLTSYRIPNRTIHWYACALRDLVLRFTGMHVRCVTWS